MVRQLNPEVADLVALRAILSLKKSKERIESLGKTITEKNDFLQQVNADLEKSVQIQKAVNKVLKESKERHIMTTEASNKPYLRLVVDNTKKLPIVVPQTVDEPVAIAVPVDDVAPISKAENTAP